MNNIRITSGKFRGRSLKTPGGKTHPMGERERLALFNMIAGDIPGSLILDAFAGSGALGIEALSRGAREVVFIEKNPKAAEIIRQNLRELEIAAEVSTADVVIFNTEAVFDLIIADPPYDDFNPEAIQHLLQFLKEGGLLVLSHPGEAPEFLGLTLVKTRTYAAAHISVYAK